jgi:hypothetical protein
MATTYFFAAFLGVIGDHPRHAQGAVPRGHSGGVGVHPMGMSGVAMDRGLDDHGLDRTHVTHELGHHHFRGLYGLSPLYDNNDCPWPADLTIESCPVGSVTE